MSAIMKFGLLSLRFAFAVLLVKRNVLANGQRSHRESPAEQADFCQSLVGIHTSAIPSSTTPVDTIIADVQGRPDRTLDVEDTYGSHPKAIPIHISTSTDSSRLLEIRVFPIGLVTPVVEDNSLSFYYGIAALQEEASPGIEVIIPKGQIKHIMFTNGNAESVMSLMDPTTVSLLGNGKTKAAIVSTSEVNLEVLSGINHLDIKAPYLSKLNVIGGIKNDIAIKGDVRTGFISGGKENGITVEGSATFSSIEGGKNEIRINNGPSGCSLVQAFPETICRVTSKTVGVDVATCSRTSSNQTSAGDGSESILLLSSLNNEASGDKTSSGQVPRTFRMALVCTSSMVILAMVGF